MDTQGTFWRNYVTPAWKGAFAGCIATAPMTAVMLAMHRYLHAPPRPTVPPKKIAMGLASRVGLKRKMDEPERRGFAWVSHFGFGTAMGTVYGPLAKQVPLPFAVKGPAFGLVVWAVSYLGWLPALDLPGAATEQSTRRNVMMIVAHLVWGSVLGAVLSALDERHGAP